MSGAALVIFDCDGVLIDSEIIACRVEARGFARLGIEMSVAEVARRFTGVRTRDMYQIITDETGIAIPEGHGHAIKDEIQACFDTELRALPGTHALLDRLVTPACVASSSDPDWLAKALGLVGLHDRLAPAIFNGRMVEHGKPAPDLFLLAAARMGARPVHCLVVEDSVAGVRAGRAAGMRVLGFAGGGHCAPGHGEILRAEGAEAIYLDMSSLAERLC